MAERSVAKDRYYNSRPLVLLLLLQIQGTGFQGGRDTAFAWGGAGSGASAEEGGGARVEPTPVQLKKNKKRIGIVDDETSLCSAYSMVVKSLGYEADFVAHDGSEAVRSVLQGGSKPDLIIMDYRMPVMDGLEAAKRILKERPATTVVIASADDSVKPAVAASGLYYLHKPFSIVELRNLMMLLLPP